MRGCDAVANLATKVPVGTAALRPGSLKAIDRIRLHGSRIVTDAAQRAGVGRIIQQSLSFMYADQDDDWIDEHSPIDVTHATEPVVVAEDNVKAIEASGGTAVSLRFGLITGNDRNTAWLFRRAAAGRPIGLGAERSWMHVIHPDDVGSAVVHALTAPGGVYNVGAEPVQRRDYVDMIAMAAGHAVGPVPAGLGPAARRREARDPDALAAGQLAAVQRPYGLASRTPQAHSGLVRCPRLSDALSSARPRSSADVGPPSCSATCCPTPRATRPPRAGARGTPRPATTTTSATSRPTTVRRGGAAQQRVPDLAQQCGVLGHGFGLVGARSGLRIACSFCTGTTIAK